MTQRLDLHPDFIALDDALHALKHLTSICDDAKRDLFTPTSLNGNMQTARDQGYTVLVLTDQQVSDFTFLIGFICDRASDAARNYQAAAEASMKASKCA